jgi:hypothetical protein
MYVACLWTTTKQQIDQRCPQYTMNCHKVQNPRSRPTLLLPNFFIFILMTGHILQLYHAGSKLQMTNQTDGGIILQLHLAAAGSKIANEESNGGHPEKGGARSTYAEDVGDADRPDDLGAGRGSP